MRQFLMIWFGQIISIVGSRLTSFALGVWLYQKTGSVTQFSLIALFAMVPGTILAPYAGVMVDRWDRRRTLIVSDSVSALSTLFVLIMVMVDNLQVWHIYLTATVGSLASAYQIPAFTGAIQQLVPKEQFARASGLNQMKLGIGRIIGPATAGALLAALGMKGLIMVDFVTWFFAVGFLLSVRIPPVVKTASGQKGAGTVKGEMKEGFKFVTDRGGLLGLLLFLAVFNFLLATVTVMMGPLVLEFSTPKMMGILISVSSVGVIVGGVIMSWWGGPKRKVDGIFQFGLVSALGLMLIGLRAEPVLMGIGGFIFMFSFPLINGCAGVIWLKKIPQDLQGRVSSVRRLVVTAAMPLGYLLSGPLADRFFEPAMREGGALVDTFGALVGVGNGRGMGLMVVMMGALLFVTTLMGYAAPKLRNLERDVPDAIPDDGVE